MEAGPGVVDCENAHTTTGPLIVLTSQYANLQTYVSLYLNLI